MEISGELAEVLEKELEEFHEHKVRLNSTLLRLAKLLKSERAGNYLRQGILRRLGTIHQCAKNIFTTFPPSRTTILTDDELETVTIHIQAFFINVYGILDNIAWVCALENQFPEPDKHRKKIGLFLDSMKDYLPKKLLAYLNESNIKTWYNDYAKNYRDATAHRIPPYVPPFRFTREDALKITNLEIKAYKALFEKRDLRRHEYLKELQRKHYKITTIVAISGSEPINQRPIYMHPQILCDISTVHALLLNFADGVIINNEQ